MKLKITDFVQGAFFDELEKIASSESSKVPDNELKNPKKKTDWKNSAGTLGWAVGGYALGTGIGQGVSKLIPKNHPAARSTISIGLPLVGVIGAELTRRYRDNLDKDVWKTKK